MNTSGNRSAKHRRYGIEVNPDRYFSVNGPAMDRLPRWGATWESDGLEVHLHPPISYEIHYSVRQWAMVFAFNGAETRGAFDDDPLMSGRRARGSACLIPPGTRVRIIQEAPQEFIGIGIPPERFAGIANAAAGPNRWRPQRVHSAADPAMAALCGEIRRAMINEPADGAAHVGAVVDAAAARLVASGLSIEDEALGDEARAAAKGEILAPAVKRRVAAEIERRIAEKLTVAELAETAGLSRSHFSRAFAASFGDSPARYLLSRRIARARALLLETDRSITEIALSCGFADHAHFSTAFRKEIGLAPRAYRQTAERD